MNLKELKSKRIKIGMTQVEIAKIVGVSLTSYRLWEQGATEPKQENVDKLIKVINEPID